jgi:TonB family protein
MRCNNALSSAALAAMIALAGVTFGAGPSAAGPQAPCPWTPPLTPKIEADGGIVASDQALAVITPAPAEAPPASHDDAYVEELPVCVTRVAPDYPAMAREAEISGQVVAHALVGADGRVHDVRVDQQHSVLMLDDAATQAARESVFIPARVNGRPVAVWVAMPFTFRRW